MSLAEIIKKTLNAPDNFLSEQHKKAAEWMHTYFGWTKYECQKLYSGLEALGFVGFGAPIAVEKYRTTGEITFGPLEYFCAAGACVQGLNILLEKHEEKRRAYLKAFNGEQTSEKTQLGHLRTFSLIYSLAGLYASYHMISNPAPFNEVTKIMHNLIPGVVPEDPFLAGVQVASGFVLGASLVLGTYFNEQSMHSPYKKKPFFRTAYTLLADCVKGATHGTKT